MAKKRLQVAQVEPILDEGEQIGVRVIDAEGDELKIKKGKGGKLMDRWGEFILGKTYEFEMAQYKGYPYVADFEEITLPSSPFKGEGKQRSQTTNESIEAQVAAKAITELWIADKLSDISNEVKACRRWFLSKLPLVGETKVDTQPVVDAIIKEGGVIVDKKGDDREFKNAGDFLMEAYKEFGYTKTQVLKLLEKKSITEVNDLTGAWVFLKTIKEREIEEGKQETSEENA